MNPFTLSPENEAKRQALRVRANAFTEWLGKRTSYRPEELPPDLVLTNEDRSLLECLDFVAVRPLNYIAYVKEDESGKLITVTTWIGERLGTIYKQGQPFKTPSFGGQPSERVNFRAIMVSGEEYSGTYYKSSGNYCRLKRLSKQP